ncbi:hypothetical protein [Myxosarcina sp. GI1(2024)]
MSNELPQKQCLHCGRNIRRLAKSVPYQIGICHKCIRNEPEFEDLRRALDAERFRNYYNRDKTPA